jgi:hypothetical protein
MKPGGYHIHQVSLIFFIKMTWGILKNEMPNEIFQFVVSVLQKNPEDGSL